ncbi:hypothetical protein [Hymenobacter jeollabukensis]|uniref:Uncharacterized protein n=1 Tax=Hymenobacter jeollabukensis TaxID=2025313 RepID=A0A5R8WHP2_9BACT|nr:hypothetical protein [Hymenobacter jeollabukensis]TLM88382.1 hypothetical protein FDY95_24705 [Hymenobacter jeollabukensis]
MLLRRLRLRRRALRLPLGLLPLMLVLLLAVQRLARAVYRPQRYVMQISMPVPWSLVQARQRARPAESVTRFYFTVPPDLDRRRWLSYTLIGNAGHDAAMLQAVAERLRRGRTQPAERADVCIRFAAGARYASLVAALDLMPQLNQSKYALDLYRPEPVLYVFVTPFRPWW